MEKEQIIHSLIKIALFETDDLKIPDLSEIKWNEIFEELIDQAVIGIPSEWIFEHAKLPPELAVEWKTTLIQQVDFYYQVMYDQNKLLELMNTNNITMAVLKGAAAAVYYPDPSARAMGDIDFIVPSDEFDRAYQLMLDNGYKLMYGEDNADHHVTLIKDEISYEIHKEPAGLPEGAEGEYLLQLIEDGLDNVETVCLDEYDVPMLPALQNGVVLLLHIVKHLKSGLGLRQIIDWMMYVNKELHDDNWYASMQPVVVKTGLETLAKAVTRMCQIYLGLESEDITWCADADVSVCKSLMDFIMQQGNFGRKISVEDKGVKILGEVHNPLQFFSLLQKRGRENWELLKKYPCFKPFAWLYMSCRYVKKSLHRKAPVKALVSDVKDGNERRELFEKLGIYQK
ncbi:MAG: nucleotidyltransferase family protein [Oscillospiraceae bacterium]